MVPETLPSAIILLSAELLGLVLRVELVRSGAMFLGGPHAVIACGRIVNVLLRNGVRSLFVPKSRRSSFVIITDHSFPVRYCRIDPAGLPSPNVEKIRGTRRSNSSKEHNTCDFEPGRRIIAPTVAPLATELLSEAYRSRSVNGQLLVPSSSYVTHSWPTPPRNSDDKLLPGFLKPMPESIVVDDVAFLILKGALQLPALDLQQALMLSYFRYTHPLMPILDLDHFLSAVVTGNGSQGQVSLLLFQAILFAGTAHVDMAKLKNAGYHSRRLARRVFFQRVRVCLFTSFLIGRQQAF